MEGDFEQRIVQYEKSFGKAKAYAEAKDFMIAYLSAIKASLPDLAREGLETAIRYRQNDATAADLADLRKKYWTVQRVAPPSVETQATTATFVLLHPSLGTEQVNDIVDHFVAHAERFLRQIERFNDYSKQLKLLFDSYFRLQLH